MVAGEAAINQIISLIRAVVSARAKMVERELRACISLANATVTTAKVIKLAQSLTHGLGRALLKLGKFCVNTDLFTLQVLKCLSCLSDYFRSALDEQTQGLVTRF